MASNIKNFNVVKLDSKGRIILPFHIRDYLGLKEGIELLVANNEKKELKIFPLINGKSAEIRIMIQDKPGSVTKLLSVLERCKVNILMSSSKTLEIGELAEWSAVIDLSSNGDIKKIEKELKSLDVVKKVEINKN